MSEFSGYKPAQVGTNNNGQANVTQQAKTYGQDLKETASELTDTIARTAKEQASDLGNAAKDIAAGASDKIQSAINDRKGAGADYIGNIAQAVHRAAGEFESEVPQAAQYIHKAADQIDTVAKAVRERNVGELFNEVQQFARRQPTAFFGGAVILGFAAIRFFKSSAQASEQDGNQRSSNSASNAHTPSGDRQGSGRSGHMN